MTDPTEEALPILKALSDGTRLRLLRLLARQSAGHALCVQALAGRLGISQPAVSQHLAILRELGLVHVERSGVRAHYFLDRECLRACHDVVVALFQPEA